MYQTARSIIAASTEGIIIEIECHASNGLPTIIIVGLGNKVVDESKERLRSAFSSTKLQLPRKRITINLAPADVPKDSTSLDLAIAASIMAISSPQTIQLRTDQAILGEIGLSGDVRPIRGIIGKLIAGKRLGITSFVVPYGNLQQASLVPGATIYPVKNLRELLNHLSGDVKPYHCPPAKAKPTETTFEYYLSDVVGQEQAKRALIIAAAGGHNILLSGPPGTGKSMLGKALSSLLPPMTRKEVTEVTHLYSLASPNYEDLITIRPFRSPHHSSSHTAIVGGGNIVRPGEISLSHCGVLFLDEMPEFSRQTLESLRQPLEERIITIARAKHTVTYPANLMLVGTANPCPCGNFGSSKECICPTTKVLAYQRKLSGPILDRIDIFVQVDGIDHSQLLTVKRNQTSDLLAKESIATARQVQFERYKTPGRLNSSITNREIQHLSAVSDEAKHTLDIAAQRLDLSPRAYLRTIKVARTIADLDDSNKVLNDHISEALRYRKTSDIL